VMMRWPSPSREILRASCVIFALPIAPPWPPVSDPLRGVRPGTGGTVEFIAPCEGPGRRVRRRGELPRAVVRGGPTAATRGPDANQNPTQTAKAHDTSLQPIRRVSARPGHYVCRLSRHHTTRNLGHLTVIVQETMPPGASTRLADCHAWLRGRHVPLSGRPTHGGRIGQRHYSMRRGRAWTS
jgi:hypothetical protein